MSGFSRRVFIGGVAGGAAAAANVATATAADDAQGGPGGVLRAVHLTTEHRVDPLGIDAARPRFGWRLAAGGSNRSQRAYRIRVATSAEQVTRGRPDMWDSGRVSSAEQTARVYDGPALRPRTRYFWTVQAWDENGRPGPRSDVAWFETALLDDAWQADWIGTGVEIPHPTLVLRPGPTEVVALAQNGTLGQTFATATELASVAVLLGSETGGAGCRLTLRRDGPGGELVAETRVTDVARETQATLELTEPAPPGEYYVEASEPAGDVGWVTSTPASNVEYPEGTAYADGREVTDRDRWVYGIPPDPPADPVLRHEFGLSAPVVSARLYLAGLGLAETWVNGRRVGDAVLASRPTDYDVRTLYTTYDVTQALHEGANAIGVALGRGFFATRAPDTEACNLARWVAEPRLSAVLEITLEDRSTRTIRTGPDWQVIEGPTIYDGVFTGESYDARIAQGLDGWTEPGFAATDWRSASVVDGPGGHMQAYHEDAIRVVGTVRPVSVRSPAPDVRLYDFGAVLAGWVRLRGSFATGATVRALYSEKLGDSGRIEVGAPGGILNPSVVGRFNVDEYIAHGDGDETWAPSFTYKGFRYVEVSGPHLPDEVVAESVHSDLDDTMDLRLDDAQLQWISDAFDRTTINGLHGYPDNAPMYTKFGWTSSTYRATAPLLYRFDMAGLFGTWLDDIRLSQAPSGEITLLAPFGTHTDRSPLTPSSTGVYPYLVRRYWLTYGDATVPERHFDAVGRYVDWLVARIGDGVADDRFGDWYPPRSDPESGGPANPFAPEGGTLVGTAYTIQSLRDAVALAELVGADVRARTWQAAEADFVQRFTDAFLDVEAGLYRTDVKPDPGYRQTSNAVALAFGLVPDEHVDAVVAGLAADVEFRDRHLNTGALGTGALPFALGDHGRGDLAHAVLNRRTYPSYGYLRELGATTFWESWESTSRGNNDMTLSLVMQWLVERAAGIEPVRPGWARFRVRPAAVRTLPGARVRLDTVRGAVEAQWRRRSGRVDLDLRVPVNAVAEIEYPNGDVEEVGSGRHRIEISPGARP